MRAIFRSIENFFFRKESASGMGLMRIGWGLCVLVSMLWRVQNVIRYYSDAGILPESVETPVIRDFGRFTILDYIRDPAGVTVLYCLLIAFAISTVIGFLPKFSTIVTYVLLASFHERNFLPLAGGDTVIRIMGFLLVLSPGLKAFSVHRLRDQWKHWRSSHDFLPGLTIPAWPRLLVTWQLVVLYVTCDWYKGFGNNWWEGTAASFPYHHPHFARFNPAFFDAIPHFYAVGTYGTLFWEGLWIFFLLPPFLANRISFFRTGRFRRWMLSVGFLFHGFILATLNVGTFSLNMFAMYLGMLTTEDFAAMKAFFGRVVRGTVTMLYDGHCSLCVRIAFFMKLNDVFDKVRIVNLRVATERNAITPNATLQELDRVVHAQLPNGEIVKSFVALRSILSRLPFFWPLLPLLWLPGIRFLATPIYDFFASHRPRCTDDSCKA